MNKERRMRIPLVGGSSLLVIFAVLCLTVFALLGLSAVQAGGRLSQKMADSVEAYYEADCMAEEICARLRLGELPAEVMQEGDTYTYVCPVSETNELQVELHKTGEQWEVTRWNVVSTVAWESDDSLDLWDGEFEFE